MGKTFVNALADSRVLRLLTIFVLSFVVVADALIIALVIKVIDFYQPDGGGRCYLRDGPPSYTEGTRFSPGMKSATLLRASLTRGPSDD